MSEHYTPQHPLPEELQKLSRDDTVCQFCGVSYLIHNEIKKLEEKLQEYVNEVERLKCFDEREKLLKSEVVQLQLKSEELIQKWEEEEKKYSKICKVVELKESRILEQEDQIIKKENLIKNLSTENTKLQEFSHKLIDGLSHLKSVVINTKQDIVTLKETVQNINKNYSETFVVIKDEFQLGIDKYEAYWKTLINKNDKEHKTVIKGLKEQFITDKKKLLTDKETLYKTLLDKQEKMVKENEENQKQHHSERCELIKEYEDENEKLSKKLQQLNEKGTSQDVDVKNQLLHSQTLVSARSEKEKLTEELDKLKENLKTLKENETQDKQSLVSMVQKLKTETSNLKDEREKMIDAHQHRIEDLRNSFLQKLKEADKWPGKEKGTTQDVEVKNQLEEELEKQQQKFDDEKRKMKQDASESYEKLLLEKEKFLNEKLAKEKSNFKEFEAKVLKKEDHTYLNKPAVVYCRFVETKTRLEHLQITCEDKIRSMQLKLQYITEEKDKIGASSSKRIAELQQKIENQLQRINELETMLQEQAHAFQETGNIDNYKHRVGELEQLVQFSRDELREKNNVIAEHETELQSLRDCVRRECEERYELTEALAVARTELLTLQRYYGNGTTSFNNQQKTVVPSPPAHGRRTASISSEDDPGLNSKKTPRSSLHSVSPGERLSARDSLNSTRKSSSEDGRERINIAMGRISKNRLKLSLRNSYNTSK